MIKRILLILAVALLTPAAALAALMAWPEPLFAHHETVGDIEFWSDRPIERDSAQAIGRDIAARLAASPLGPSEGRRRLFIANDGWRRLLLWNVTAPGDASGYAAFPWTRRHAFLAGADFPRGALIAPDGRMMASPRTLAYYGAHELFHLRTGEYLGTVRFIGMPTWIKEGIADYVALKPREPFAELRAAIDGGPDGVSIWRAHGYYAQYRLLVRYFLEVGGWSFDRLLASDLTLEQARARMRARMRAG